MSVKVSCIRAVSAVALAMACASIAPAQSTTAPAETAINPSPADMKFMKKAMQGGLAEVQLGQLASQKASADDVKQFGQKMVEDHTKLNDQMKGLAPQLGVTPPDGLSAKDQQLETRLQGLSGTQFDQAYLKAMVADHKQDVHEFKQEAATTQNPQLKDAVKQGQQVISGHLKMVEQLAKSHNVSNGAAAGQ